MCARDVPVVVGKAPFSRVHWAIAFGSFILGGMGKVTPGRHFKMKR